MQYNESWGFPYLFVWLKASSPFEGVDPSEFGDIDADTSGFMDDLDLGLDTSTPVEEEVTDTGSYATVSSDYQTGYETDFADAMFSDDFSDDDPFGAEEIAVDDPPPAV